MRQYGPQTVEADRIHADKHRNKGETFRDAMSRIANAISDSDSHFTAFREILLDMRFMPAGRIQRAVGSLNNVTPYNCFVSGTIEDSYVDGEGCIMARAHQAAATMRLGGGIGYDFSTIRPRNEIIRKQGSAASGPVSFMGIFNSVCIATASAGNRRGAQMAVLRVDHPDIEEYIRVKQNSTALTGFNLSIAVTDEFMKAVEIDHGFDLRWGGKVYRTIRARDLWEMIMRSTYDYAEPGVLFIDAINRKNNLYYCETIAATNPCGEQPLPPFGACLLGSINTTRYLQREGPNSRWKFNWPQLYLDIPHIIRAMDNVVDRARYPLYEQEKEAVSKRRMGIGVTGVANTIEALGYPYGSPIFIDHLRALLTGIRNEAYRASAVLAQEKGPFPLYSPRYLESEFVSSLPDDILDEIEKNGIRNSHLLSIAPTGTISLAADNVSSGIEPVFAHTVKRVVLGPNGPEQLTLQDYGVRFLETAGKTTEECSVTDHLNVLKVASQLVDSAVSKTINVPKDVKWDDFKDIYFQAWKAGCKGCTTYRKGGKREGILEEVKDTEPTACYFDPETGAKHCE